MNHFIYYVKKPFVVLSHWRVHMENLRRNTILRFQVICECMNDSDREKIEVGRYLCRHKMTFLPYDYPERAGRKKIRVYRDEDGYPYVIRNNHRLYYKKDWSEKRCQQNYNNLQLEQDTGSPHAYILNDRRKPCAEDVVADLGAAEGIFGLDVVETVKKLYLFEGDSDWIEPLKRTFRPWTDKVTIVSKYIGNQDDGRYSTLDTYFKDCDITYLKADIEGAEEAMFLGGGRTFKEKLRVALICAYHTPDGEETVRNYLEKYGFQCETNPGYVLFFYDKERFCKPYVRRGVIAGIKTGEDY